VRRSLPQTILNVFDAPVMEINCTRRPTSTSATQALALMNSDFVSAQAGHFADRILEERPTSGGSASPVNRDTAAYAFKIALTRNPTSLELDSLLTFLERQKRHYAGESAHIVEWRIYSDLCQALLSANEFIYVD
jgi:hypothetical protein